jgi:hypothetical protein
LGKKKRREKIEERRRRGRGEGEEEQRRRGNPLPLLPSHFTILLSSPLFSPPPNPLTFLYFSPSSLGC